MVTIKLIVTLTTFNRPGSYMSVHINDVNFLIKINYDNQLWQMVIKNYNNRREYKYVVN